MRSALVILADVLNGLIADTVLLLISRTNRALTLTEVAIDPATEINCGLRFPSVVSCNNLLTIDQGLIAAPIGKMSTSTMQQIDLRIKTALGLT